jgi:hypothetical protein
LHNGKASFIGGNVESVLHGVQNPIHNYLSSGAPYFANMNYRSKVWSYFGRYGFSSLVYQYMSQIFSSFAIVLVACFFASCLSTEKANCEFGDALNNGLHHPEPTNLKMKGAYHLVNPPYNIGVDFKNGHPTRFVTHPFLHAPWFFFENGTVLFQEYIAIDSMMYVKILQSKPYGRFSFNNWGVYTVSHDTVRAIVYIIYEHDSSLKPRQLLMSYFQGIARSNGTIEDWHMIEPLPEKATASHLNESLLDKLTEPSTLHFKDVPIGNWIDPKLAWIHKLQKRTGCE